MPDGISIRITAAELRLKLILAIFNLSGWFCKIPDTQRDTATRQRPSAGLAVFGEGRVIPLLQKVSDFPMHYHFLKQSVKLGCNIRLHIFT